ncbi:hypothetical protein ACX80O_03345 [Arthrobacter sp. Hz1]
MSEDIKTPSRLNLAAESTFFQENNPGPYPVSVQRNSETSRYWRFDVWHHLGQPSKTKTLFLAGDLPDLRPKIARVLQEMGFSIDGSLSYTPNAFEGYVVVARNGART